MAGLRTASVRQAAALVATLALFFHIGAMAFGAGRISAHKAAAQVHVHHGAAPTKHDTDAPVKAASHEAQCCILSICPGLPAPPTDHILAFLPAPDADTPFFSTWTVQAERPTALTLPLGARAPPVLV
ncbi:hypothetical protein [Microvirga rosea]|uniref:hypothetical protein n=1 Tax=Microvirga rosea TaxID=2715425 RepID=UPI001D09A850|nr:hypothetical protein [Microvirga rosea]MCB8821490.1 hypothetical protein [Microvirga rosea]